MTHSVTPDGFRRSWQVIGDAGRAAGRDMAGFGNIVTAIININDDTDSAMVDAQSYLSLYYGTAYTPERLHAWGPIGTPQDCAAWIRRFHGGGCQGFTFRLATMGDATIQLRRLMNEVLPLAG